MDIYIVCIMVLTHCPNGLESGTCYSILEKCKYPHTRHGNEDVQFTMGGTLLSSTVREYDLALAINAENEGFRAVHNCIINWKYNY